MSRFQAQTSALLDGELTDLRRRLGLRDSQKAELLRELADLAAWVIRQVEAGRQIEARRGRDIETLHSPALERLRRKQAENVAGRIDLTETEVERLVEIFDRGFAPTPALREVLAHLSDPGRRPPQLRWKEAAV